MKGHQLYTKIWSAQTMSCDISIFISYYVRTEIEIVEYTKISFTWKKLRKVLTSYNVCPKIKCWCYIMMFFDIYLIAQVQCLCLCTKKNCNILHLKLVSLQNYNIFRLWTCVLVDWIDSYVGNNLSVEFTCLCLKWCRSFSYTQNLFKKNWENLIFSWITYDIRFYVSIVSCWWH